MVSNSALVSPGGSLRRTSFNRGEAAFGPRGADAGAFFCRTETGRTPLTPFGGPMADLGLWWRKCELKSCIDKDLELLGGGLCRGSGGSVGENSKVGHGEASPGQ